MAFQNVCYVAKEPLNLFPSFWKQVSGFFILRREDIQIYIYNMPIPFHIGTDKVNAIRQARQYT